MKTMNNLQPVQNRFFAIAVDNATPVECQAFTSSLSADKSFGYWHWMNNLWIVQDPYPTSTAQVWRLKAERFMPNATIAVIQFSPDQGWAIRGPAAGNEWLFKAMNGQPQA
jgi:hypothetical protein